MPQGLDVKVWRDYDAFLQELGDRFPAERAGIKRFYDECWRVFDALNSLELKSLEEPRYLLTQFARHPLACLTLASFLATNTGDVARMHIKARHDSHEGPVCRFSHQRGPDSIEYLAYVACLQHALSEKVCRMCLSHWACSVLSPS